MITFTVCMPSKHETYEREFRVTAVPWHKSDLDLVVQAALLDDCCFVPKKDTLSFLA